MSTAPVTRATDSPASAADPCVYFDGACPLRRAEIASHQRAEGGAAARWVDAQAYAPEELGGDLEGSAALARMHVRRADGTLVRGAAAFVEIWSRLPRRAVLARLARLPGVVPLLDLGYRGFLRVRPLWRPRPHASDRLPRALLRELRTDHAGETGAVMIYRGVLAVARDPVLRNFARHHLETETRHLAQIEQAVPPRWRSRLLPLWRLSGWLTGALPACFSPRAVYATIEAVETFVDRHYAAQVAMIDEILRSPPAGDAGSAVDAETSAALASLRALLERCRWDEVAHRDDAGARWRGPAHGVLALWRRLVGIGSEAAVSLCRRL